MATREVPNGSNCGGGLVGRKFTSSHGGEFFRGGGWDKADINICQIWPEWNFCMVEDDDLCQIGAYDADG